LKTLALLCILLSQLLSREVSNGSVELIEFSKLPKDAIITMDNTTYPIHQHPSDTSRKYVLIPIKYRSSLGEKKVTVTYANATKEIALHVIQGDYTSEKIHVAPSKVKPNNKQKERTSKEYKEAMSIYHTTTPTLLISKPFISPLNSKITSNFGTARMFNNTLKSFHSGTDFRAKTGTKIKASNDGIVVLAKDRYYAGNSVILNHGHGIYSCYYHLSALHVKVGDKIKQSDVLGLSGQSGRVSGPHLHYAFMVQGVQVNPLEFHNTINTLF